MRVRAILTILFVAGCSTAFAQVEGTQYFMNSLPQYVSNNPAFFPRYKFALGLPGSMVGVSYYNNGFTYNDATRRENGKRIATLDRLIGALPAKTYITGTAQVDLFRFGLRITPKAYLSINSTVKNYNRGMIPKDAVALLRGNMEYVGKTAHVSPGGEMMVYWENSIGLAVSPTDELSFGARVKLVRGFWNATTGSSDLSIAVAENYNTTFAADLAVKTSGLQTEDDFKLSNFSSNNGVAFDLGATYTLFDKLTLAASLVDIGAIKWKANTYQYTLDKATANYTFSGVDINRFLDGDEGYFEALSDSIGENFKPREDAGKAYSTMLPTKMFASAQYEVLKNFNVGTVFFAESFAGRFSSGMTLAANKHFGRFLSTSVSYSISNRSFNNLGAGLSLNLAPIQIYVVGDNLLRLPISLAANKNVNEFLNSTQVFNLRFGVNFVWGWMQESGKKAEDKSYNAKKKGVKTGSDTKKHPSPEHINVRKKKR
ncbi:MAG TPA: DUF5723 family protein [Cyclobacteriaceae bacterium]|nr:DUF5723 family protein [Cyclobacteriaceae bacterium]